MLSFIKNELEQFNIDLISCLKISECELRKPYLLECEGIYEGSVVIFAVPYLSYDAWGERNVSSYAVSRDYHYFFKSLFDKVIGNLKSQFPEYKFAGFTDHSPINEIAAASRAGLGVIGENHMLITEKHSSYIFIGEIITDAKLPPFAKEIQSCIGCGLCRKMCPVGLDTAKCLSALTQKKGVLTNEEESTIKSSNCAWGCDICQQVCPHTKKALENGTLFTKINFFNTDLIPILTSSHIDKMNDNEFQMRAYSWRGKDTIKRNLEILEGKEK